MTVRRTTVYTTSPLSQGRGSKHSHRGHCGDWRRVAPLAGAWIETPAEIRQRQSRAVAPLAGAWIETPEGRLSPLSNPVAPLAGAWIETSTSIRTTSAQARRPSRRGVDRNDLAMRGTETAKASPLSQGRGSKHPSGFIHHLKHLSPLSQGRGSKRYRLSPLTDQGASPLSQGRGSKLRQRYRHDGAALRVAPLAGAWIETPSAVTSSSSRPSRPSRRGVDRNMEEYQKLKNWTGRPSRRGVDRNLSSGASDLC